MADIPDLTSKLHDTRRFIISDFLRVEIADALAAQQRDIEALREALHRCLSQWKMYADMEPDRDISNDIGIESDYYRRAASVLAQTGKKSDDQAR